MPIPVHVHVGALSGRRAREGIGAAEVEGALAAVAERALRQGARAGLEALLREALRLTGLAGIALYEGRVLIAQAGLKPPPLSRARAPQVFRAPDGRTALVVLPDRSAAEEHELLLRLARFASTLQAARRREAASQARQARLCRELRHREHELAFRERNRSRASHDLRTPLLVMKGYVDMMLKGMTGDLTPTMERYLERMLGSTQDMSALISRHLAPGGAPETLLPLLRDAFERLARPRSLALCSEGAEPAVVVRAPRSALELLSRALARGLATTGTRRVDLHAEVREALRMWRLRLCASAERSLPTATLRRLEPLVHRLGGTLRVRDAPDLELTLQLPAVTAPLNS